MNPKIFKIGDTFYNLSAIPMVTIREHSLELLIPGLEKPVLVKGPDRKRMLDFLEGTAKAD